MYCLSTMIVVISALPGLVDSLGAMSMTASLSTLLVARKDVAPTSTTNGMASSSAAPIFIP